MDNRSGKFIVIDGTDGAGKTTQLNLLAAKLKTEGYAVAIADFPQYNTKSGGLVEEYLSGKYGGADEVDPYKASVFYAVDRYDASFKIKRWLQEGKIVLANRYVSSNMGHQGGKFENPLERKVFFNWLYDLEYRMFNIPKPDLSIILHVEAAIAQQLAQRRKREDWIGKTKDIHEGNLSHLQKAEQIYLEIARDFPDFKLIKCTNRGELLKPDEIHYLVWIYIKRLINIGTYQKPHGLEPIADIITKNHRLADKIDNQMSAAYKPPLVNDLKIKKLNDWLNVSRESDTPINIAIKEEMSIPTSPAPSEPIAKTVAIISGAEKGDISPEPGARLILKAQKIHPGA
ncbi:MAG: dTMP kinase, partial [Candidatus Falkowbacteria bacterium]|nr:dTMP kinase [Candidatus Falkowbacteria bacterium]